MDRKHILNTNSYKLNKESEQPGVREGGQKHSKDTKEA